MKRKYIGVVSVGGGEKDRYSAVSYSSWIADILENKNLKKEKKGNATDYVNTRSFGIRMATKKKRGR